MIHFTAGQLTGYFFMPKISVIIPNYNHANFLKQRIETVLDQTYQDFEVILLDDASNDESLSIIDRYSEHPKIKVFINKKNSGSPFRQWQRGVEIATGDYIWIAESDDYSEPDFLERMIAVIDNRTAFAYCRSVMVNEKNEVNDFFWADGIDKERWKQSYTSDGTSEIANFLMFRNTVPNASSVLFRREWASFNDPIPTMRFCGDWLFWINLIKSEDRQVVYIPEKLNYFRTHAGSTRSKKNPALELRRLEEYFIIINHCMKIAPVNSLSLLLNGKKFSWVFDQVYDKKKLWPIKTIAFLPKGHIFLILYYKHALLRISKKFLRKGPALDSTA